MSSLKEKSCIPCQGGVPPLEISQRDLLLKEIDKNWKLISDKNKLYRKFEFKDFATAMNIAVSIGELAEKQWHHPDLKIGWGYLEVEIWTHKIGSLVESDFILAAKIDAIVKE